MAENNGKRNNNKNHPLNKIKRRARLWYLKLLRLDDPPERIARGAAIGVLMGVLPTFGLGGLLSLAFAWALRGNKAAAIIGSAIVNPLTAPFFWTASILTGSVILGRDSDAVFATFKNEDLLNAAGEAALVYMAGNAVLSAVFTIASYFLVKTAITGYRARKERKRREREANLS
ncbi:MAG: DUF2062 domain-containing protein [Deltaproteobacteria bacterium]|nr:DUF2062 domain-containing protein [Deltaproteobacteria bacterium]